MIQIFERIKINGYFSIFYAKLQHKAIKKRTNEYAAQLAGNWLVWVSMLHLGNAQLHPSANADIGFIF